MRYVSLFLFAVFFACGGTNPTEQTSPDPPARVTKSDTMATDKVTIHPVFHGSAVLTMGDRAIYVDPYGGGQRYTAFPAPELVLITHTHGDHLDSSTLVTLDLSAATLIAPRPVIDALPGNVEFAKTVILANGEDYQAGDIDVNAIPAYNLDPEEQKFHPEGKFNGYVLDIANTKYYFSGDTEDVPAMRQLRNIDVAFVCINQPYTMTLDQAVSAVLDFKPEVVYPYHYRNGDGSKTDVEAFKQRINDGDATIEVRLADWYRDAK